MADDNKPMKYARYAVGEIVLVVIGILIALQVNNWNTNRMQRIEEQKLLGKIRKEFIQNKKQLLDKIELRDLALASTKELLQLIDHKNSGTQDSKVDSLLAFAVPVYTFDPFYDVMSQLIQVGKLTLIRNDFRTFLYKYSSCRNVINDRIKNGVITSTLIDKKYENTSEICISQSSTSSELLLSSKEFENFLASLVSHISYLNAQSSGVENYMNNVIGLIEKELKD